MSESEMNDSTAETFSWWEKLVVQSSGTVCADQQFLQKHCHSC